MLIGAGVFVDTERELANQREPGGVLVELRTSAPGSGPVTVEHLELRGPSDLVREILARLGDREPPPEETTSLALACCGASATLSVSRPDHLRVTALLSGLSSLAELDFLTATQRGILLRSIGGADVLL